MRRLLLLLAFAATAPAATAQPYAFDPITKLLADSLPAFGGGEFLLMQHGRLVYRQRFGGWDSTRAVPIASATKWPSAGVVMALVGDGTLSLDDTVGRWLPDAPADKRAITVRQLFSHTSGLSGGDGVEEGGCLASRTTTLDACARAILAAPLLAEPGAAFRYGGLSMQVAGRIAEAAAGRSFNTLFAERIAGPLGMTRTHYGPGDNPRVAGGASSTAADYARFLQMLLDHGRYAGQPVLAPGAVEAMLADQTRGAPIVASPYLGLAFVAGDASLAGIRYGIGNWREVVDAETGAALESASQGAFGFSPWIDRGRGVVAVLAVRDQLRSLYPTYLRLKTLVREAIPVTSTAIPTMGAGPDGLRLDAPAPNPAAGGAALRFTLPAASHVRLAVYDALGREVAVLHDGPASPGVHAAAFPNSVPAGVYLVRLATPAGHRTRTVAVR